MKRPGPLRRKASLRSGAYLNRTRKKREPNKPLRGVSKKRQKLVRKHAGARRAFVNEHCQCAVCGHSSRHPWKDKPLACSKVVCHEIANGQFRAMAFPEPCTWLPACRFCNEHVLTNKAVWPEARQLCLKMVRDPGRYDLAKYLNITSPAAPRRIEQGEVDAFLETVDGCSADDFNGATQT